MVRERALSWLPHPFLLHSSLGDERSRWSFFGADPFQVYRGTDHVAAIEAWRRHSRRVRKDGRNSSVVPFTGGVVQMAKPLHYAGFSLDGP